MRVQGSVALVTGANRGLGARFVAELLAGGASKVYAAARRPDQVTATDRRVVPLRLDLEDTGSIEAAAATASDVELLVNNAGVTEFTSALGPEADIRRAFEVNVFGTLAVTRAFAPGITALGGGAVVNVLSVLSWIVTPGNPGYAAAKSALWSLTNALRLELVPRRIGVVAVHCGVLDTDMSATLEGHKLDPSDVARQVLAAVESGAHEVLTDRLTHQVRQLLSGSLEAMYPALGGTDKPAARVVGPGT